MSSLSFQVLGPLRVWRDGVELDTGPRQQAYLLTLLLMRAGRPIGTSELIDLIWDDDMPTSAVNIVQKYVGTLRRLLEPDLPARAAGSFIDRRNSGYQFDATGVALDLLEFRELVAAARTSMADGRVEDGVGAYERALATWRGSAGDGLAVSANAAGAFAALNAELLDASVEAARAAVPHGHAKRILQPLRLAAWIAPFDETVQATLMTTLAAAGQQAEALSVYDAVRGRLEDELGIEPGAALRDAHQQVLLQSAAAASSRSADLLPSVAPVDPPALSGIVGRREELALLRHAVDSASFGRTQLVLVEGPPGVGKSRLLAEIADEAAAHGALTVWGRCQEGDGAPSMWPWVQVVGALVAALPAEERGRWTTSLGEMLDRPAPESLERPDAGAQFRLFDQVAALVTTVAERGPVMLVVDDLHWADRASLALFAHLAESLPANGVLVGTLRDRAPTPSRDVVHLLAAVARQERHRRIALGPLNPAEVAELVRRETGQLPPSDVARSIQARTEGNPLFVRELARFLADEDRLLDRVAVQVAVPSTVRDIVDDRASRLEWQDRRLAEIAALIGRDIDVRLLARAADVDVAQCLARLESLAEIGLVEESPVRPGEWRFVHDLMRESVARSTARPDASGFHLRIADALTLSPSEQQAEAMAHHLRAAGALAEPERTVRALLVAGRVATGRSSYDVAERQLASAAQVAREAGLPDLELTALTELTAVAGIHSGFVGTTLDHLDRAEELARSLGREREATGFLFSRFLAHAQGLQLEAAGRLARRLLDHGRGSSDAVVRASGHHAWGVYQWSSGNIDEAYRNLSESRALISAERDAEPLRHRLQMLTPVMLALNTALHGDLDTARRLFDEVEAAAGEDAYALSIWGSFAVTAAAVAGDAAWALRAADRAIAADPDYAFTFSGSYPRLARHWALAEAAEVERIIEATLADPPRSNLATWYALLGEVRLAAGDRAGALAALDKAEAFIEEYGERYAEGLVLLIRARALGTREAALRARRTADERGALLFVQRADELLDALSESVGGG